MNVCVNRSASSSGRRRKNGPEEIADRDGEEGMDLNQFGMRSDPLTLFLIILMSEGPRSAIAFMSGMGKTA